MKKRLVTQSFSLAAAIMVLTLVIVAIDGCQKENTAKANDALTVNTPANSSIIYTDISPDIINTCGLNCSQTYQLDLNKDGQNDFMINIRTSGFLLHRSMTISIAPADNNTIAMDSLPLAINSGISIASSFNWGAGGTIHSYSSSSSCTECPVKIVTHGNWNTPIERYAGLKISVSGNIYYGWVRMSISSSSSFTVKDYAYNSKVNQPILAGQTK